MRKKIGEEVEFELGGRVADHHAIGIRAAQQGVGNLEFIVDFLCAGLFLARGTARQFGWRAKSLDVHVEVGAQCLNELRHDAVRHHDACSHLRRMADVLNEIQREFGRAGHDNHPGAERAATYRLRHPGRQMLDTYLLAMRGSIIR